MAVRRHLAVLFAATLMELKKRREAKAAREERCCSTVQRVFRGMMGRHRARRQIMYWQVRP